MSKNFLSMSKKSIKKTITKKDINKTYDDLIGNLIKAIQEGKTAVYCDGESLYLGSLHLEDLEPFLPSEDTFKEKENETN